MDLDIWFGDHCSSDDPFFVQKSIGRSRVVVFNGRSTSLMCNLNHLSLWTFFLFMSTFCVLMHI